MLDRRDLAGTVRSYLREALADDSDREEMLRLADELLGDLGEPAITEGGDILPPRRRQRRAAKPRLAG